MEQVKAVVSSIERGHRGLFAVAYADELEGSITFGLDSPVWREDETPEPGSFVVLADIYRKKAGWRARAGRFYRPSDEQYFQADRKVQQDAQSKTEAPSAREQRQPGSRSTGRSGPDGTPGGHADDFGH